MTEITEYIESKFPILFYDAHCPICVRSARRFGPLLRRAGVQVLSLYHARASEITGLSLQDRLQSLALALPDRSLLRGFDALLWMARELPLLRPVALVCGSRLMIPAFRRLYGAVARRRYCLGGADQCKI